MTEIIRSKITELRIQLAAIEKNMDEASTLSQGSVFGDFLMYGTDRGYHSIAADISALEQLLNEKEEQRK